MTGAIDPARVLSNASARPGDVLVLTKPLGTGIVATALKFGRAPDAVVAGAVESMTTLNRAAAEALAAAPPGNVHACTDITGFGLIGHASEMAAASGVSISIETRKVPILAGALELGRKNLPGGGKTNEEHFASRVRTETAVASDLLALLYDPQTSGGLLAAIDPAAARAVIDRLESGGVRAVEIGAVRAENGPAGGPLIVLS